MKVSADGELGYAAAEAEPAGGSGFDVRAGTTEAYPIRVAPGGLARLAEYLLPLVARLGCTGLFVVSDSNVLRHHQEVLLAQLDRVGLPVAVHRVPVGERNKNFPSVLALWEAFDAASVRRRTLVISVGGGVVSDVAGFAAHGYLRGLPLVLVPTTLLAQVDAAIGGKNGVTHFGKKNRVGGFHHPKLVLVDPEILKTLPAHEMSEGMAEATKIAYLTSDDAVETLWQISRSEHWATAGALPRMITSSIERKLQLLRDDPYESRSLDRALNLGHCFGHPIEQVLHYRVGHGSAVAIGMSLAGRLGVHRGLVDDDDHRKLRSLLDALGLPAALEPEYESPLWAALDSVREVRNGDLRPVIPVRPGEWVYGDDVTRAEWQEIWGASR